MKCPNCGYSEQARVHLAHTYMIPEKRVMSRGSVYALVPVRGVRCRVFKHTNWVVTENIHEVTCLRCLKLAEADYAKRDVQEAGILGVCPIL